MTRLLSLLLAAALACASASAARSSAPATAAPTTATATTAAAAKATAAPAPDVMADLVAAVPPPPAIGSDEAKADLAIVFWMQRTRMPADVERAKVGAKLGPEAFAPALGAGFDPARYPKTVALLKDARARARSTLHAAKDRYDRKRPYDADPRVIPAVDKEPSSAYPSGHATYGQVLSRTLAELAPERRDALLAVGATIGHDRVLGGVHWPSDVLAGQKLGAAVADRILANPEFRRALDEVKRSEWSQAAAAGAAR